MDWTPVWISIKLSLLTTCILLAVGIPLGYWLTFSKFKFKIIIKALTSLPLVLPPTVLGFYILVAFSPKYFFGGWLQETIGWQVVFSFSGLVIGSVIYSLPFMINPIQAGFSKLSPHLAEASHLLGKSKWITLRKVLLPNIKTSLITGVVLTFAHTLGEFGVVLMIGGNIPQETRTISIAIYEQVELMNYEVANTYALALFSISLVILIGVYTLNESTMKKIWL